MTPKALINLPTLPVSCSHFTLGNLKSLDVMCIVLLEDKHVSSNVVDR